MSILETLHNEQIFYVEPSADRKHLRFTEACDDYFDIELTKAQVIELANELLKLAETLPDE